MAKKPVTFEKSCEVPVASISRVFIFQQLQVFSPRGTEDAQKSCAISLGALSLAVTYVPVSLCFKLEVNITFTF